MMVDSAEQKANERAIRLVLGAWEVVYKVNDPCFLENTYSAAQQLLEEFVTKPTPSVETLNNYGVMLFDTQRELSALNYFLRAIDFKPPFREPYRNALIAINRNNKTSEYAKVLERISTWVDLPHSQLALEVYRSDEAFIVE